jgi:DNA-binding beta-propeller fold protein YncE
VAGEAGLADGSPTEARFSGPAGLAVARDKTLLVADTGNHMIRRVSRAGDVTTVAGAETARDDLGRPLGGHQDGPAHGAQFRYPVGLAVSDDRAIYVADAGNHCVRRIDENGEVTTLSTEGEGQLEAPTHLAFAEDGRLWVADPAGGALWVGPASGPLQPWEPPEDMADLSSPAGLAFVRDDGSEPRLVVADSGANCLWEVGDGRAAILAGVGSGEPPGWRDGPGDRAQFSCPAGVATGPRAGLLVADFGNNCVRQVLSRADAEEVE